MKTLKIVFTATLFAAVLAATLFGQGAALAGTLDASTAMPHVSTLSDENPAVTVKHIFAVGYYNNEKFSCGARMTSSDGTAAKNYTLTQATTPKQVVEERQYKKAGIYQVTLSGYAWGNYVACLGSQTSTTEVKAAINKKPALDAAKKPADQAMSAVSVKAKLMQVVLKKNEFMPGTASMYSTIYLDKASQNCRVDFVVKTNNTGTGAINFELMRQSFGGIWNAASTEYNPGTLELNATGKYRVTVSASTDVADNQCTGSVGADFEVKRMKLFGNIEANSNDNATLTVIKSKNFPNAWEIEVAGTGDKDCKYHVNLWSLPEMSIFKSQAMTYKKGQGGNGLGVMMVEKPAPGKGVRVEAIAENDDKADNKGCLGQPTLDLQVALPPKGKTDAGDTIKPAKGLITGLTIPKKTFVLGETIPAILKLQGDTCHFVYKIRTLPMVGPDIAWEAQAYSNKPVNDWDLNNLGAPLGVGNWEIFIQPSSGPLPSGQVGCDIAPGQATRVLFSVTPKFQPAIK